MSEKKKTNRVRVNQEIRIPQVRLIDADGEQVGVVPVAEAQSAAKLKNLDLVEIVPNAEPPVCRIMDYGKYRFDQKKKKMAAKKKQTRVKVKEIKFRPNTDIGDYEVKLRNLMGFLEQGNKVKVTIRFRGREFAHQELGMELLSRLESDVGDKATVELRPKLEGRQMIMILAPKK